MFFGVVGNDSTVGGNDPPPWQSRVPAQHAADRTSGTGKAGLGGNLAVAQDVAGHRRGEHRDDRCLER